MPSRTLAISPAGIVLVVPGDHAGGEVTSWEGVSDCVIAPGVANELGLLAEQAKA